MRVGYTYLVRQFAEADPILALIKDELTRCQFTLGPQVAQLEAEFARVCHTRFAVGVNSGTDALFLSLKALGIGPGDEVITAPNSFIATAAAIANVGAKPVFVDVNDEYNIDPNLIEKAITPRTKAIIPVHLTGNPADMPAIMAIARRYSLYVIEDACQAINAAIDGQSVGSFGISGCFSLHPLKNINIWGDGGVIVTNAEELYRQFTLMRNHGLSTRDECQFFAYNSRLDTIQSIVALEVLKDAEWVTEVRNRNARTYDAALRRIPGIQVPPRKPNVRQVFHTYVILARDRDRLISHLAQNGVEAKIHYPIPIHLQEAASYLGYKRGHFPVCEAQADSIISLPIHQYLTEEDLAYVIRRVGEFYG